MDTSEGLRLIRSESTGALGSIGDLFTSLGAPAAELGKEYGELKEFRESSGCCMVASSCGKPRVAAPMQKIVNAS